LSQTIQREGEFGGVSPSEKRKKGEFGGVSPPGRREKRKTNGPLVYRKSGIDITPNIIKLKPN
jgi:hypothetical protein